MRSASWAASLVRAYRIELRSLAAHDDTPADSLPRLVVEVERAQPFSQRVRVPLVVELDVDAPVLGRHRGR